MNNEKLETLPELHNGRVSKPVMVDKWWLDHKRLIKGHEIKKKLVSKRKAQKQARKGNR